MNRAHLLAVFALLLAVGLVLWQRSGQDQPEKPSVPSLADSPPREPGLSVPSAVREEKPTFVGREACKECHAENFHLHAKHGHAHTFASASDPEIVDKFDGRTYETGRIYGTYTYHADEDGLFARIPERFGEESFPLQYALGSGHNAITLLSLMADPEHETVGIEHRASWYRELDQLGSTPGQVHTTPETLTELFGQKHVDNVMHKCVYCHTTTGQIVDQQIVDLTPNVNCEKCHGPGSVHVKQARSMETPPPFSVGNADWDTESEIQLCGDCHRLPANFTRKELRGYPDHFTRFQPIGLLRSECYLSSKGQLRCTTCHSPHRSLTEVSPEQHVQNCLRCHQEESESHVVCPVSPSDGCIDCHMPRIPFEEMGLGFHDHWIRVREDG